MIRFISIFLIVFFGSILSVSATDNIFSSENSIPVETFQFDKEEYSKFKSQKKYDYYQQFKVDDSGWLKDLEMRFYRWLQKNFSPDLTKKQFDNFMFLGILFFMGLLILLLYIYKPSLFYLDRKKKLNYRIEDEDETSQNLDRLILRALEDKEYEEAIQWKYRKVLQLLNEKELISFDPHKTVNEYVYEITRDNLKTEFKELSLYFAYYRYGNGEASLSIFEEFDERSNEFLKQLSSIK
ncbi:hypothetical protein LJB92_01240 [Bacteroidales bacterium OttesenSCG-928-M06]|nr:hypothetical protein [Bacteroidales bacterium OttesenSCG-928-M06]